MEEKMIIVNQVKSNRSEFMVWQVAITGEPAAQYCKSPLKALRFAFMLKKSKGVKIAMESIATLHIDDTNLVGNYNILLISGSDTAEKFMTYEWDLSRPTGTVTEQAGEVTERHCPNCGAPLSVNESAKCPYCDTVLTFQDHDWTIYAVKGIAQRTVQS